MCNIWVMLDQWRTLLRGGGEFRLPTYYLLLLMPMLELCCVKFRAVFSLLYSSPMLSWLKIKTIVTVLVHKIYCALKNYWGGGMVAFPSVCHCSE